MLFNSNIFLYVFLPILIGCYFFSCLLDKLFHMKISLKNIILLFFSILFYLFTGGKTIAILIFVVLINYILAILINRYEKKYLFIIGIFINLGILFIFKYANFFMINLNFLSQKIIHKSINKELTIILPIGISFYIFQALSYLIDVYKKQVPVQKNFLSLLLYVSFFPQLIAGPIVRYDSIQKEISNRCININQIYEGVHRFILGLFKKVCLANLFGQSVDKIFLIPFDNLTIGLSWSGLFLYTLQIYYDFSAYSDMAIGLGKIFGFNFCENFEMPYTSKNITEFWRRWHISLSSFLRDYLYIPLGGNRKGNIRTYINLFIVFILCGLWHGANYTFILWGGVYGILMIFERWLKNKLNFQLKGIIGNCTTFLIVMFCWLIFRSPSIGFAKKYFINMFLSSASPGFYKYSYYIPGKTIIIGVISFLFSIFNYKKIKFLNLNNVRNCVSIIMLVISMAFMSDASFSPFIYFQF